MSGIATTCKSNPETGRDGCGAPYRGRQSHCVAPAPWSTHADGLCHETFGAPSTFDMHWTKVGHVDPRTVAKLHQDDRGVWKKTAAGPGPWDGPQVASALAPGAQNRPRAAEGTMGPFEGSDASEVSFAK